MAPRIKGPVITHELDVGFIRTPMATPGVVVGDRYVPPLIEVDFPGVDGQPGLHAVIEVLDGVPRWTEVSLERVEGGREIREKDLRAIRLDAWMEEIVAICSGVIVESGSSGLIRAEFSDDESALRAGMKTIRDIRKGSRRPLTSDRRQRVADVYNAQETRGIDAVEKAFGVSKSTAVRYIKAARDAGLIEKREN